MQQEKLILTAKAKAAKAYARAEELCLKLKAAIKASMGCNNTTSPSLDTVHSHKKSKGTAGVSTASPAVQLHQYLSPQRKNTTITKRVSVQLPRHFPSKTSSLSPSSDSDSLSAGILMIGSDLKRVPLLNCHVDHDNLSIVCPSPFGHEFQPFYLG